MLNYIRQQIKDFNEASFLHALKIFMCVAGGAILYCAIFSGFQIVDEFEHLHASWLISEGKLPYRDFFEHHHPLLWYVFAPVVGIFYDNVIIFYILRGISVIVSVITLIYVYKISLFFTSKTGGIIAIVLSLSSIITLYNFHQFRPDNFMNLFFIMGIYYWLLYLKDKQNKSLTISFVCFAVSVMFLQKISILLMLIEIILLVLIIKKRMQLKTTIISAIPAIILLILFIGYFVYNDIFYEYISLNLRFNQALVYYFDRGSFWHKNLFYSLYGVGFVACLYLYKKQNLYFRILAIIYIFEFLMRALYFSPHPNYYTLLTFLNALVLSPIAINICNKYKHFAIIFIVSVFIYMGNLLNTVIRTSEKYNSFEHFKLADFVHKNSNKQDILMNGYDKNFNIYRKDASYYWFGLDMLIPVMEKEFGLEKIVDINQLILLQKPKFIYTLNYVDLRALRTYGEVKYSQTFNPYIINILYEKTQFDNLAKLK